jgi:hypothetical protein
MQKKQHFMNYFIRTVILSNLQDNIQLGYITIFGGIE